MAKNEDKIEYELDAEGKQVLDAEGNPIPKKKEDAPKPPTPPTPPGPSGGKKKTVEVDAETLNKLVSGYEALQQKVTDLEGAADIGRLQRIQAARNQGKLVKNAKVNVYENKIVLGWVLVKDDVFFDEAGKMHEDQQIKLFLDEGEGKKPSETSPMSYRQFARLTTKLEGEVIGENKDRDGKLSFKLLLPNGREIELPIVFLN